MAVTQSNSIDSTSKCNATTDESTLNTSDEIVNEQQSNDLPTEPEHSEPDENQKSDALPKLVAYREFLLSDLKIFTFTYQGREYTARHSPIEVWTAFFSEYADLDPTADWTDLEERAELLTQLWMFCAAEALSFPLTEKLNALVTIS